VHGGVGRAVVEAYCHVLRREAGRRVLQVKILNFSELVREIYKTDLRFYSVLGVIVLAILVIGGATYKDIANLFIILFGL
jgi:hypothetical protein